jgi:CRISPR-associated endonuclease Cas3-HD
MSEFFDRIFDYLRTMVFWAHSDPLGRPEDQPGAKWQLLAEHLENVEKLARDLASRAAPAQAHFHDLVGWAGLLHDLGKYQDGFQQMIRTGQGRCPHAIHGAAIAHAGQDGAKGLKAVHIALAIAGHHAGMPDLIGGGSSLQERVKAAWPAAAQLIDRATQDSDALRRLLQAPAPKLENIAGRFDLLREVSLRRQHKIDRVANGIHRSVEIRPLTGDADVSLIQAPGTIRSPEFAAEPLIQNGRETLDPTPDRDMFHGEAPLRYYFLQIPVAEGIPQVPADTQ